MFRGPLTLVGIAVIIGFSALPRVPWATPAPGANAEPSPELPDISALAREIAILSGAKNPGLIVDPALHQAARRHAEEISASPAAARLDRVQAALIREGLADAAVLPFSAVGPRPRDLADTLRRFASTQARPRGATHLGLALTSSEKGYALVALFSRRLVALAPLAPRGRPPGLTVQGRARPEHPLEALLLGPCEDPRERRRVGPASPGPGPGDLEGCSAPVRTLEVERRSDRLATFVPLDRGPGRYVLELVATTERGPEVAALWTFAVDVAPGGAPPAAPLIADGPALARRLDELRAARGLGPLTPSAVLDRAASAHAEEVCRTGLAAHVLGGSGPTERARRAGWTGGLAENVAIAPSLGRAHQNLLASPSHLKNILDPMASTLGLGLAQRPAGPETGAVRCVVQLFGLGDQR